jgi:hypothetical protein
MIGLHVVLVTLHECFTISIEQDDDHIFLHRIFPHSARPSMGIFREILSVPQNIVMDLNNVMTLNTIIIIMWEWYEGGDNLKNNFGEYSVLKARQSI